MWQVPLQHWKSSSGWNRVFGWKGKCSGKGCSEGSCRTVCLEWIYSWSKLITDRYVEYSENIGKTLNTLPYLIPSFRISKIRMCLTIDGISASIKHGMSKGYPGGRTQGWGVMTRDFCTYSISFYIVWHLPEREWLWLPCIRKQQEETSWGLRSAIQTWWSAAVPSWRSGKQPYFANLNLSSFSSLAWGTSCASALGNVLLVISNTNPCILVEPKKTGEGIIRRIGGESNPWWIQGCDLAWTKMPSGAKLRVFRGFSLSLFLFTWSAHPSPSLFRLFHLQDKRWLSHCYQIISLWFKW